MKLSARAVLFVLIFSSGTVDCHATDWLMRNNQISFFGVDAADIPLSDPDLEMRAGHAFFLYKNTIVYKGKEVHIRAAHVALCSVNYVVEFDPALTHEYERYGKENKFYLGLISIESIENLIPASDTMSDIEIRKGRIIWKVPTEEWRSYWKKGIDYRRGKYCPKPSV